MEAGRAGDGGAPAPEVVGVDHNEQLGHVPTPLQEMEGPHVQGGAF